MDCPVHRERRDSAHDGLCIILVYYTCVLYLCIPVRQNAIELVLSGSVRTPPKDTNTLNPLNFDPFNWTWTAKRETCQSGRGIAWGVCNDDVFWLPWKPLHSFLLF